MVASTRNSHDNTARVAYRTPPPLVKTSAFTTVKIHRTGRRAARRLGMDEDATYDMYFTSSGPDITYHFTTVDTMHQYKHRIPAAVVPTYKHVIDTAMLQ